MIDSTDYDFKLLLRKKAKNNLVDKTINDYHMNRKYKIQNRLNKSSNDLINEPKAKFIEAYSSSLSARSTTLPLTTITNHFSESNGKHGLAKKLNPTRKSASSYLSNLNLVLDPIKTAKIIDPNQWKSFYIKKMFDFGFSPFEAQIKNENFQSNSDSIIKTRRALHESLDISIQKRLKSGREDLFKALKAKHSIQTNDLNSDLSKSYYDFSFNFNNQKNKSAKKFFSPSLIICK